MFQCAGFMNGSQLVVGEPIPDGLGGPKLVSIEFAQDIPGNWLLFTYSDGCRVYQNPSEISTLGSLPKK